MKTTKKIINSVIGRGVGSLKYFKYWSPGVKKLFKTKKVIAAAITLKLLLYREDKSSHIVYRLDYEDGLFKIVH